jgi:hypothetical protein
MTGKGIAQVVSAGDRFVTAVGTFSRLNDAADFQLTRQAFFTYAIRYTLNKCHPDTSDTLTTKRLLLGVPLFFPSLGFFPFIDVEPSSRTREVLPVEIIARFTMTFLAELFLYRTVGERDLLVSGFSRGERTWK